MMDQHSIASKRILDQVKRANNNSKGDGTERPNNVGPAPPTSSTTKHSAVTNTSRDVRAMTTGAVPYQHNPNTTQANTALNHSQLQIKRRQEAERAAIKYRLRNDLTRQQYEIKKQKEINEKTRAWEEVILPNYNEYAHSSKVRDLCIKGIPTNIRGKVWPLLIGNDLNITEQLFDKLNQEVQILFQDKMTAARSKRKSQYSTEKEIKDENDLLDEEEETERLMHTSYELPDHEGLGDDKQRTYSTNIPIPPNNNHANNHNNNNNNTHSRRLFPVLKATVIGKQSSTTATNSTTGAAGDGGDNSPAYPDITEEPWFQNERQGSLDAAVFVQIQRQLFTNKDKNNNNNNNKNSTTTSSATKPTNTATTTVTAPATAYTATTTASNTTKTAAKQQPSAVAANSKASHDIPMKLPITEQDEGNSNNNSSHANMLTSRLLLDQQSSSYKEEIASSLGSQTSLPNTNNTNNNLNNSQEHLNSLLDLPFDFDEDDPAVHTPPGSRLISRHQSRRHHVSSKQQMLSPAKLALANTSALSSQLSQQLTQSSQQQQQLVQQPSLQPAQHSVQHQQPVKQPSVLSTPPKPLQLQVNNNNNSQGTVADNNTSTGTMAVPASAASGEFTPPRREKHSADYLLEVGLLQQQHSISPSNDTTAADVADQQQQQGVDGVGQRWLSLLEMESDRHPHHQQGQPAQRRPSAILANTEDLAILQRSRSNSQPTKLSLHSQSHSTTNNNSRRSSRSVLDIPYALQQQHDDEDDDEDEEVQGEEDGAEAGEDSEEDDEDDQDQEDGEGTGEGEEDEQQVEVRSSSRRPSQAGSITNDQQQQQQLLMRQQRILSSELTHQLAALQQLSIIPEETEEVIGKGEGDANADAGSSQCQAEAVGVNTTTGKAAGTKENEVENIDPKLKSVMVAVAHIEFDLPRTFPTLAFFHDGGIMHTGLERILHCYALYQPEIGYIQGMSFLVAMLLLQCMDEYEAFRCFANILNQRNLHDFYKIEKDAIDSFTACFDYYFKKFLPLLYEHFREEGVSTLMFLMDWHLSLFTKALPLEVAAKVWDSYLFEGEVYILCVGLGILKMFAARLSTYSVDKISPFLLHLPENIKTDELFANIAQITINQKSYEKIRKKYTKVSSPKHSKDRLVYSNNNNNNNSLLNNNHGNNNYQSVAQQPTTSTGSGNSSSLLFQQQRPMSPPSADDTTAASDSNNRPMSTTNFTQSIKMAMRSSLRVFRSATTAATVATVPLASAGSNGKPTSQTAAVGKISNDEKDDEQQQQQILQSKHSIMRLTGVNDSMVSTTVVVNGTTMPMLINSEEKAKQQQQQQLKLQQPSNGSGSNSNQASYDDRGRLIGHDYANSPSATSSHRHQQQHTDQQPDLRKQAMKIASPADCNSSSGHGKMRRSLSGDQLAQLAGNDIPAYITATSSPAGSSYARKLRRKSVPIGVGTSSSSSPAVDGGSDEQRQHRSHRSPHSHHSSSHRSHHRQHDLGSTSADAGSGGGSSSRSRRAHTTVGGTGTGTGSSSRQQHPKDSNYHPDCLPS